jgi:hypothetical protein
MNNPITQQTTHSCFCCFERDIEKGEELLSTYYSAKWRKCFKDLK